jgi:hypothetical protein
MPHATKQRPALNCDCRLEATAREARLPDFERDDFSESDSDEEARPRPLRLYFPTGFQGDGWMQAGRDDGLVFSSAPMRDEMSAPTGQDNSDDLDDSSDSDDEGAPRAFWGKLAKPACGQGRGWMYALGEGSSDRPDFCDSNGNEPTLAYLFALCNERVLTEEKEEAAVLIQQHVRAFLARRRC